MHAMVGIKRQKAKKKKKKSLHIAEHGKTPIKKTKEFWSLFPGVFSIMLIFQKIIIIIIIIKNAIILWAIIVTWKFISLND
jgi:hypothetical protein